MSNFIRQVRDNRRCVNAYEDLVAALERIREMVKGPLPWSKHEIAANRGKIFAICDELSKQAREGGE